MRNYFEFCEHASNSATANRAQVVRVFAPRFHDEVSLTINVDRQDVRRRNSGAQESEMLVCLPADRRENHEECYK